MGRGMILVIHVHRLSVSNRMRIALYMSPIDPVLNQIRHGKVRGMIKCLQVPCSTILSE